MDTAELLDRLERDLHEDAFDSHDYWDLIEEAWRRPERPVFRRAVAWTADPDPLRRQLGAIVLGQLGPVDDRPFLVETEPVLMGLLGDEDPGVVVYALFALEHQETGDPEVIARLATHPDREIRYGVTVCFSRRHDPVALRALLTLMEDEDDQVRDWATFGVGAQREDDSPEIREALFARLDDRDSAVVGEAISGLARRGDPRVIDLIREGLEIEDPGRLDLEPAEVFPGGKFLPELERLAVEHPDDPRYAESVKMCRFWAEWTVD